MCLILDTNKYGDFLTPDESRYGTCEKMGADRKRENSLFANGENAKGVEQARQNERAV